MWEGWWVFNATEGSGMPIVYPVGDNELIQMPALGGLCVLTEVQDKCCSSNR
jgi:hypothetical protein